MSCYRFYLLNFMLCIQTGHGASNYSLEGRIVKGFKMTINYYPHSVFLHFKTSIPTACGGSLITVRSVITAAHCLDELVYNKGVITAYLGASVPMHSKVIRRVVRHRTHPKYNPEKGRYNLGLVLLRDEVPLNRNIKKIPIQVKLNQPNDELFTSGWGKQVPKQLPDYSDMRHLKVSKQRLISTRVCQNYTGFKMSPAYWCTVSINGYHYHGDSGNGLVTKDLLLLGVVSYMINEATIYSDVTREKHWIFSTLASFGPKDCRK